LEKPAEEKPVKHHYSEQIRPNKIIMKTIYIYFIALTASIFFLGSDSASAGTTGTAYAVQILTSQTQLQPTDTKFKGISDIREEAFSGSVKYKYTTGWTTSISEAKQTRQRMIDAGFAGAFIVTYKEGTRVVKTPEATASTTKDWNTSTTPETGATEQTSTSDGNTTTATTTKTTANKNTVTMTTTKKTTTTMWVTPGQDGSTTTTTPTTSTVLDANSSGTTTGTTSQATPTQDWNATTTSTTTTPTWNNTTTNTTAETTPTTERVKPGFGVSLVQKDPEFPGGYDSLYVFIRNHLSYVMQTQSRGEWKKGYLSFDVDKTGKTSNAKMLTGITPEVDREALNMIKQMPNWTPATVAGNPINKQYILPLDCFVPAK